MFILKKGHQPGVYVPLRALFLVFHCCGYTWPNGHNLGNSQVSVYRTIGPTLVWITSDFFIDSLQRTSELQTPSWQKHQVWVSIFLVKNIRNILVPKLFGFAKIFGFSFLFHFLHHPFQSIAYFTLHHQDLMMSLIELF